MSSIARFDTWQAADGTNVARYVGGQLETWDGSAWVPAGTLAAVVSATTGSPTITTDGSATVYTFTANGSITISAGGLAEVLVVGGGGGAANNSGRAGGGGGEVFETFAPIACRLDAGTHSIVIGAGGASTTANFSFAGDGTNSSLGSIVAFGGGGGVVGGAGGALNTNGYGRGASGGNGNGGNQNGGGAGGGRAKYGVTSSITGSAVIYGEGGYQDLSTASPANTGKGGNALTTPQAGAGGVVIVRIG